MGVSCVAGVVGEDEVGRRPDHGRSLGRVTETRVQQSGSQLTLRP